MKSVCIGLALLATLFFAGCGGGGNSNPVTPPVSYQLDGLDFGPYITGSPSSGPISDQTLTSLIGVVRPYTKLIRVYTTFDIKTLASRSHRSRSGRAIDVYDTATASAIATRARQMGLQVAIGCWLSKDLVANDREMANLIALAQKSGNVDIGIIGSEDLYRGDLTAAQLVGYINQFKAAVPGVPAAVADDVNFLIANPSVINASDVVLWNDYPGQNGISLLRSVYVLRQDYLRLKPLCGARRMILGETGWASAGGTIYTQANQATYFITVISWSRAEDVEVWWFSAFDEPWKVADEGPFGGSWGIWNTSLQMKPGMSAVFEGKVVPDIWTKDPDAPPIPPTLTISGGDNVAEGWNDSRITLTATLNKASNQIVTVEYDTADGTATAGSDYTATSGTLTFPAGALTRSISVPIKGDLINEEDETLKVVLSQPQNAIISIAETTITLANDDQPLAMVLDYVPKIGEFSDLTGRCYGLDPTQYKIAVYIKVNGSWWLKPYFEWPYTPIGRDGKWTCDITTGGVDETATDVAAFLIGKDYTPTASSDGSLPIGITTDAVKYVIKDRTKM
jgi:glucan 1,3-beta-glucosidase